MIAGTGIDSVEIARFAQWHTWGKKKLSRIFSESEIEYCLSNQALSAQRFAVRFAAREALFKAITAAWPAHTIPFFTLCHATKILKKRAPELHLSWGELEPFPCQYHSLTLHLSLTHTNHIAMAIVIIESL
jgi:holo-[acyl-carrier protein] synthase